MSAEVFDLTTEDDTIVVVPLDADGDDDDDQSPAAVTAAVTATATATATDGGGGGGGGSVVDLADTDPADAGDDLLVNSVCIIGGGARDREILRTFMSIDLGAEIIMSTRDSVARVQATRSKLSAAGQSFVDEDFPAAVSSIDGRNRPSSVRSRLSVCLALWTLSNVKRGAWLVGRSVLFVPTTTVVVFEFVTGRLLLLDTSRWFLHRAAAAPVAVAPIKCVEVVALACQ